MGCLGGHVRLGYVGHTDCSWLDDTREGAQIRSCSCVNVRIIHRFDKGKESR